ncbi:unnamed protein product, partial [Dibothriocephalus latus]
MSVDYASEENLPHKATALQQVSSTLDVTNMSTTDPAVPSALGYSPTAPPFHKEAPSNATLLSPPASSALSSAEGNCGSAALHSGRGACQFPLPVVFGSPLSDGLFGYDCPQVGRCLPYSILANGALRTGTYGLNRHLRETSWGETEYRESRETEPYAGAYSIDSGPGSIQ